MSEPDYQVDEPSEPEVDYESEARKQGWVPEDEWRGDNKPDEFVDAKTFVERGKEIDGKLKNQVNSLKSEIDELKQANREFKKYHDRSIQKERQERETLMKELEERREQAITEGDGQTFTQVDRQLNELRADEPPTNQEG